MSTYVERIRWFLGELKRVKSGLFGFILLFILVGVALAFPLIANQQDVKYWSGHAEYWQKKMLPILAPPAWINLFSPQKYAVTHIIPVTKSNYTILNMSNDKDLMKYLELMNPDVAKALKQLPASQRKALLNNLRKGLHFKYLIYIEKDIVYDFRADIPPSDIEVLAKIGPIVMRKGLVQGINILFSRPDGITLTLTPGASTNITNPFNINQYADLMSPGLLTRLGIPVTTNTSGHESFNEIAANTTWLFSLRDYISSVINSRNPAIINAILGPILRAVNATIKTGTYINPMVFLMSKAEKGIVSGTAPPLKGRYVLSFRFLIKVPKGFEEPRFIVEKAKVLGVYGLLGTDIHGRDLWPAFIYGVRWALLVGILVSVISTFVGVMYGVISGYLGGWVDVIMTRIAQVVYSLPVLPLLIILAYFFGPSIWNVIIILIAFGWVGIVFTVRSMVLQIKENLYVEAARAIGASSWRIIFKHVFPQILPYTFASMALSVPGAILAEAGLSFLGLGDPNLVTWGKILHDAQAGNAVLNGAWWWVLPPGIGIAVVGMTFVFIGYALDRILNPRLIR